MIISMPKVLLDKLGSDGADALTTVMNTVQEDSRLRGMEILEQKFERRLAEVERNLIKWMFIFWVGQVGTILGILFVFFKK